MGISNPRPLNSLMVDVPPSWRWARLDEICNGVFDCPHTTPKLVVNSDYLVVRTQDILTGIFRHESAGRVSADTYMDRIQRAEPVADDLLYSREGTYFGIAAEVPKNVKVCLGQRMMLIRPKRELINSRYLRYWLNSPLMSGYIYGYRDGSVAERLNLPVVRGLPVALPPLQTQHVIAGILGALDDKIELNRRMNATLESMARAVFQELVKDEGGEEKLIGDVVTIVGGSTPSTANLAFWDGGDIHWATPKDLAPLQSPFLLDTNSRITALGLQEISSGLLPVGTVLLSSRAPIGYLAIAQIPTAINQGFIAIKCTTEVPNYFVVNWLKANMEEIIGRANGTTFLEISKSNFRPMKIVIPPPERMKVFIEVVEPLYQKIVANLKESRTLANLRDSLLPKLMRGEVRVK